VLSISIFSIILVTMSLLFLENAYPSYAQRLSDFNRLNGLPGSSLSPANSSQTIDNGLDPQLQSTMGSNGSQVSSSSPSTTAANNTSQSVDPDVLLKKLQRPLVGSFGDDRIMGTDQTDVIIAFSGSDTINAMNGSDSVQGNEGQDKLYGEEGDDILQGGIGSDQLYGSTGDDILAAGGDDDFLSGEAGNDKMYGDLGDDILVGGAGADYFDCGEGVDVVADFNLQEGDDRAGNCEELIEDTVNN
jgi:Ca2+-binding RTX toxin-like protein